MTEPSNTQIISNMTQLRQLIDELGNAVDQQQTLITTHTTLSKPVASQTSEELARLLVFVRRNVEDLERRVKAQEKEKEQLAALQDVGAIINSSLDLNEVLSFVMDAIIRLTQAERSSLLLRNEETKEMELQVGRNIDQKTIEKSSFEISRSIVKSVAESGEPVVTMNAQSDPRFAAQESIISYNLRSILCVPLKIKEEIIGVIYADNRVAAGIFNDADRDLLAIFANQAAVAIENARLFRETHNQLEEIREMRDLMDNVFKSIASGVITVDEEDRIRLYNQAAERLFGMSADSVVRQTYQKVLQTLQLPVAPLIEEVKLNGSAQTAELDVPVYQRPDKASLSLTISPLRGQDEMLGVAMVLNDLTETKRLDSVRRYLPPALVDQVRDIDAAQRPQRRTMSVLFADVRGFSTYSENLDPEILIEVINGYFTEAVRAINTYKGLTDKFMGDAVMALFNTPLNPQAEHIRHCIETAWMIQQNIGTYHATLPEDRRLDFGVGIHTGEAVVGNVGSDQRKDYSAIGDAVNLAKRLQEMARPGQVLISQDAYNKAKDFLIVDALPPMQVKGRQALEQVFVLKGIR